MSKYKAIFFDLDGTLLPMDINEFTKGYFGDLCKKLADYGVAAQDMVNTIWKGVGAMVANDGSRKNVEAFWEKFYELLPNVDESIEAACEEFYANEFKESKRFTQDNPRAKEILDIARKKADIVVLATNPQFPMAGHRTRLSFIGLTPEDFDLVTSYESDCFCKPNHRYFETICERIGVEPSECLMIGNDEHEDMYAGTKAGLDCFLVTDTMIPSNEHPWNGAKGNMNELIEYLSAL